MEYKGRKVTLEIEGKDLVLNISCEAGFSPTVLHISTEIKKLARIGSLGDLAQILKLNSKGLIKYAKKRENTPKPVSIGDVQKSLEESTNTVDFLGSLFFFHKEYGNIYLICKLQQHIPYIVVVIHNGKCFRPKNIYDPSIPFKITKKGRIKRGN